MDMNPLSPAFIRDVVIPEIERSGGATVEVPTSGNMSPALLVADDMQPRTWIVGVGPLSGYAVDWHNVHAVERAIALVFQYAQRSVYTGVGFWLDDSGVLVVDVVECYTLHEMARIAARKYRQDAIYELHTGTTEYLAAPVPA